jgi:manganese/iron transport system ATP-binding protein
VASGDKLNDQKEPARLELEHVYAGYGNQIILQDLSFQVPHGGRVAVVGPNGAGKSTLFKVLVGLLPIKNGKILIHGLPLDNHNDCVGYVPQREEVDWRFPVTVSDVVMMGRFGHLRWMQRPGKDDRRIVAQSLEQLGISGLARTPIGELSGGQQQRVFLARALAQHPHILLMDEPFTGVDISTQESTLALLDDLKRQNVTVMTSTHDLNMASERFELVLLLNRSMIAFGSPDQVFTPEAIRVAFKHQVLFVDGAVVVDQCCPPEDEHLHGGMS